MATLIRLKQIESGSTLQTSAQIGADFSGAVYQIIDGAGLVSSSQQIDLTQASNYAGFVAQLDVTMSSDLEASIISSSISQSVSFLSNTLNTISSSINGNIGSINNNIQTISGSLSTRVNALEYFSSTLDNTYATDAELITTSSQIIDQGEW